MLRYTLAAQQCTRRAIGTIMRKHDIVHKTEISQRCQGRTGKRPETTVKLEFYDADIDTDIIARILADSSDTPTYPRKSSRGCWCRCRRRGMRALTSTEAANFHRLVSEICGRHTNRQHAHTQYFASIPGGEVISSVQYISTYI